MTKNEIKAILDLAGIAYPKKANLEVLTALLPADNRQPADGGPPYTQAEVEQGIAIIEAEQGAPIDPADEQMLTLYGITNCPHCEIHLDNGVGQHNQDVNGELIAHAEFEFACLACGGEFGPAIVQGAPAAPSATGTGLKIEKDREEKNGIKRPSIGGKCRAVWDALDAHGVETGEDPTAKDVKAIAEANGWNPNNASIEFYQWRKFNGITKAKVS